MIGRLRFRALTADIIVGERPLTTGKALPSHRRNKTCLLAHGDMPGAGKRIVLSVGRLSPAFAVKSIYRCRCIRSTTCQCRFRDRGGHARRPSYAHKSIRRHLRRRRHGCRGAGSGRRRPGRDRPPHAAGGHGPRMRVLRGRGRPPHPRGRGRRGGGGFPGGGAPGLRVRLVPGVRGERGALVPRRGAAPGLGALDRPPGGRRVDRRPGRPAHLGGTGARRGLAPRARARRGSTSWPTRTCRSGFRTRG